MAVNCCVVPLAMLGLVGVTVIDTSVGSDTLDLPSELPQPVNSIMIIKRKGTLDFIGHNSLRDYCRRIGTALKVSHMPPFLHDDVVGFNLLGPLAMYAKRTALSFLVFISIGTEQLSQVRINEAIPGDAEYGTQG